MSDNRVFVTGLGMISPAGTGTAAFWNDLCSGRNRFEELPSLYPGMKAGVLGGRVSASARASAAETVAAHGHTPFHTASLFAEYAALEALSDARLTPGDPHLFNAIVCIGTSDGQADALEKIVAGQSDSAVPAGFSSYTIAEGVARMIDAHGPTFTVQNTCASANVALSCALELLRAGVADTAVVGGCDPYSEKNIIGFASLHAIGPTRCAPFTKSRRFVTPSEGAGILVLQNERSIPTGQRRYAEVLAAAVNNDASHPTAPDHDGVRACHRLAAADAGIELSQIDAIFAHGTGSRANDVIEATIFAEDYPRAAITAIKGTVGHLMGGAGAAGAVAACLALKNKLIPPTTVDSADLELDVNLVTGRARSLPDLTYVQNNAFGFGGTNAISIFGAPR